MSRDEPRQQEIAARQKAFSRVLARTMAMVGVLTVVIVAFALLIGAWLDRQFGMGPLGTIAMLVLSIPAVTVVVFVVVRRAAYGLEAQLTVQEDPPQG